MVKYKIIRKKIKSSIVTLCDPSFHQKILRKYHPSKYNPFRFPIMIFFNNTNTGHFMHNKINMEVFLQFHFANKNEVSSSIKRTIQSIKILLSWFTIEKFLPQLIPYFLRNVDMSISDNREDQRHIQTIYSDVKWLQDVSLIKIIFAGFINPAFSFHKILCSLPLKEYSGINPNDLIIKNIKEQIDSNQNSFVQNKKIDTYHANFYHKPFLYLFQDNLLYNKVNIFNQNKSLFNRMNQIQPLNIYSKYGHFDHYPSIQYENIPGDRYILENGSTNQNSFTSFQPLIKQEYLKYLAGNTIFRTFLQNPSFSEMTKSQSGNIYHEYEDSHSDLSNRIKYISSIKSMHHHSVNFVKPVINIESFYFQNFRKIEQAVEDVKKITAELKDDLTKKSVSGQYSLDKEIQQKIDINQISDQVYRMLDYRLKIEKERRGYL